jgi:hypothetical protein
MAGIVVIPKKKPTRKPVSADVLARFDQRRLTLEHNSSDTVDPLLSLVARSRVGRAGHEQHQPMTDEYSIVSG